MGVPASSQVEECQRGRGSALRGEEGLLEGRYREKMLRQETHLPAGIGQYTFPTNIVGTGTSGESPAEMLAGGCGSGVSDVESEAVAVGAPVAVVGLRISWEETALVP